MNYILIYSTQDSSRFRYTLGLVLDQILGVSNWRLTLDLDDFLAAKALAKINYSQQRLKQIPQILPQGLLWKKDITPLAVQPQLYEGRMAAFFVQSKQHSKEQSYPFDLLSWIFYLVSRYEEYLPFEADQWGRFSASSSVAAQYHFLEQPIINEWVWDWAQQLQRFYPALQFNPKPYIFTPSYDIDHAFAFAFKPWWRQAAAWARNIGQKDQESLQLRRLTRQNTMNDPYYVYPYIQQLAKQYQHQPLFFWLLGNYGIYDKNLPAHLPIMKKLIQEQQDYGLTGIHPSFASNASLKQLSKEVHQLQNILQQPIRHSRQHYLRLHLPTTYQRLLQLGIQQDYSMGYACALGFRASIATPFTWYDLEQEQATALTIYPFAVMDVTLHTYLQLDQEQAMAAVLPLIHSSKAVQGHFIPVWHNSSLCEAWQWKGWRRVYEYLLEMAN
ncbi:MAG: polysaccharide deacetylase family protein [Aureispira sp.]